MERIFVIKIGGAVLDTPGAAQRLFEVLQQCPDDVCPVVVHGGGDLATRQLQAMGMTSEKRDGIRVTPAEHLPLIVGALAGFANKQLVAVAKQAGLKAIGLSLADGDWIQANSLGDAWGCVGQAEPAQQQTLLGLLELGVMPVMASIGMSAEGELLNINADDAAVAIASLLNAELVLLTDVPGVLDAQQQLIPELSAELIEQLIQQKVISGGMVVKVRAAQESARQLRRSIAVTSWKTPELLPALMQGQAVGSRILAK